jgi:prepilin-type processing-associated H-X9-DG protein
MGQPLQARLFKVQKPSEVLLYADCGTRPQISGLDPSKPLDFNDALNITTNYMFNQAGIPVEDAGRLSGIMKASWLAGRIPWDRHGGRITGVPNRSTQLPDKTYAFTRDGKMNVGFCDGHAESVLQGDAQKVRVSPYALK